MAFEVIVADREAGAVYCAISGHKHEVEYLYTDTGSVPRKLVYQCPTGRFRFSVDAVTDKIVEKFERPNTGWKMVALADGRIVTSGGKVTKRDDTRNIPDSAPWPLSAEEQYSKPTRFTGYTAEDMGF